MTSLQARTAQAIIDLLETGRLHGGYDRVTALPGKTAGLTYGRAQARLASGALTRLIMAYLDHPEAALADRFTPFKVMVKDRSAALSGDRHFHNLLRAAADDPVMRTAQDAQVLDAWTAPIEKAGQQGIGSFLGAVILAEGLRRGGWETLRKRTDKSAGPLEKIGEPAWLNAYLDERTAWLAAHRTQAVRETHAHMTVFRALSRQGNWDLRLPIVIDGTVIDEAALNAQPVGTYAGPLPGSRALALQPDLLHGGDIRRVQLSLSGLSVARHLIADGIYGPLTADAVSALQDMLGLAVTGRVDAQTLSMIKP